MLVFLVNVIMLLFCWFWIDPKGRGTLEEQSEIEHMASFLCVCSLKIYFIAS